MSKNPPSEEPVLKLGWEHTVRVSLKAEPMRSPERQSVKGFDKTKPVLTPRPMSLLELEDRQVESPSAKPVSFDKPVAPVPFTPPKDSGSNKTPAETAQRKLEAPAIKKSAKFKPSSGTAAPKDVHRFRPTKPVTVKAEPAAPKTAVKETVDLKRAKTFEKKVGDSEQEGEQDSFVVRRDAIGALEDTDLESLSSVGDLEKEWAEPDEENRGKVPLGWFVLLGLVLTTAIVFAIMFKEGSATPSSTPVAEAASLMAEEDGLNLHPVDPSETEDYEAYYARLEQVIRQYFAAEKISDLKGILRHERRVLPLAEKYHRDTPLVSRVFQSISSMSSIAIQARPFLALSIRFEDGSQESLLVEDKPSGPLVDWETNHVYQPMDIEEFINARSAKPVDFRLRASITRHYSHQFQDDSRWISFRLSVEGWEDYLIGYIERDTQLAQEFRKQFRDRRGQSLALLLKIRFPEEKGAPKAVLIDEIVSPMWAYGANPDSPAEE